MRSRAQSFTLRNSDHKFGKSLRFAAEAVGRYVNPVETEALLSRAFEELLPSHTGLTRRALDHTISLFERGE